MVERCYDSGVRRFVGVIVALAVAVGVGVSTTSASLTHATSAARVNCRSAKLTFFFWPGGHNAVPSINFPSFPYPHLELYKSANTYPNQNFFAGIGFGPTGQPYGGFAPACAKVKSNKLINSKPAKTKTAQPTMLVCNFPKAVQLDITRPASTPVTVGIRAMLVTRARTAPLQVSANIVDAPTGSTLRFNGKYCKAFPPPQ